MIGALTSVAAGADLFGQEAGSINNVDMQRLSTNMANKANNVSFEQVLSEVSEAVGTKLQNAESLSMGQVSGGDVGVRDVVHSIMEAERSLSTAIALRDKMVQAYLEVSRMQI